MNVPSKRQSNRKEMELWYHSKLDQLSLSYTFQKIETSIGDTNIVITGNPDHPPLVLIHGPNGCAPLAIEALGDLIHNFRIFALDVVGYSNLSKQTTTTLELEDFGSWVYEIMSRLRISNTTLVGLLSGASICMKALLLDSKRIADVFLIRSPIEPENPISDSLSVPFLEDDWITLLHLAERKKIDVPINLIVEQEDIPFFYLNLANKFPSLGNILFIDSTPSEGLQSKRKSTIDFIKKYAQNQRS